MRAVAPDRRPQGNDAGALRRRYSRRHTLRAQAPGRVMHIRETGEHLQSPNNVISFTYSDEGRV